ncbi:ABC transporter permease [Bacillus sp. AFS055030]|uniref:ABC transporter permease n=1 Tax=Bacillus sp. AFS055030 TaxID=2033507 RepID=UPI000BFE2663|nr:ABC transporter permease [Bacillus sp. AFS055030]PGL67262.1 sodium export permease [Bacillus sp. AFS055030]
MKKFSTVFFFHLREGLLAKATLIMSVILFLLVVGVFGVQKYFAGTEKSNKDDKDKIVLINHSKNYSVDIASLNKTIKSAKIEQSDGSKEKEFKNQVEDGSKDGLIILSEKNNVPSIQYTYKKFSNSEVLSVMNMTLQQDYLNKTAQDLKLSPESATKLLQKVEVNENVLEDPMATFGIAYFFGFLLYMFLLIYGNSIATGIVAEKSSRVMEVLLPKVSPVVTLYGRVIAVFFVACAQLVVLGLGFLFANLLGWVNSDAISFFGMKIDLEALDTTTIIAFVVYFLLGYLLYGLLYAAIGSVVSRTEELQMVLMPITILVIAAFFISINALVNPDGTFVQISSYIPFFAPLVAFSRFVSGEMNLVEISASILILIVSIMILTRVASRIYVNGVMYYSEKVKWKDVARLLKRQ